MQEEAQPEPDLSYEVPSVNVTSTSYEHEDITNGDGAEHYINQGWQANDGDHHQMQEPEHSGIMVKEDG